MEQLYVHGILLTILAVISNFVAETLNCKLQRLLSSSMFAKHIAILLTLYFALGVIDNTVLPHIRLRFAILVWVSYVFANKINLNLQLIAFLLLIIIQILNDYNMSQNVKVDLQRYINYCTYSLIGLISIGSFMYFKKQYHDHRSDFNVATLLFGSPHCDYSNRMSMKEPHLM